MMKARIATSPYTGTKFIDLALVELRNTDNDDKYKNMLLSPHYRNERNRESVHNYIISSILNRNGPLVETGPDIIIVGDLHGSLFDARRVYNQFRVPMERQKYAPAHVVTSFLFLGNYVDRGENSLEVLLLLFTMKLAASFYKQREQADDLFEKFNDIFDHMPLACLIAFICINEDEEAEIPKEKGDFIIEMGDN
ncbi:hypothetical protein PRIPAC_73302 [Pristionchus pacificus]|uniref:Calcineurin-like phosphoesterase n=1 Tax=Pristionchus pacificus TaxID=54126 RepID=A0A2A6C185_PRIPA|nr:hypothetical protein PRIPAC_73302 [Pristionchus pacificus]|eukprot:PDM71925.1 Calcineurin-like phosphoesterase [Pristionchus pacificus]